ncbi:T9SS type B sorting domain-containing protein [Flagellimonas marinaquae]
MRLVVVRKLLFKFLISTAFLLFIPLGIDLYAQGYQVRNYQKINETNGGFIGDLDDFDSWGIAIDNIGDLDGNGVNDLAVGAYTDDDGGVNRGAVWILFLDVDNQVLSQTKISDTSGNFTGILDNDDRFGGSVSYLGDLNSDGLIELAVGADYDGDGGYWHGAVWILSLNPDGTVNSHVKISDTQGGFGGAINGDAIFGTDMENIGDLNDDGVIDLAVGSRRDADGGSRRGAVWILFMNPDLTVNSFQKISDTQGGFTPALQFEDYFGGSILNFGDQNGDGNSDILVGTYRDDDLNMNSGAFYLLYLNDNGTVIDHRKVSNTNGGLTNTISSNALFGESIDGVNDIDGDGIPEVLVGALGHNNPTLGFSTGAFYLVELDSNGIVTEDHFYTYGENCFSGNLSAGDFFGGAVTLLQTGPNPKIAVSAYHDSENGPERGAVWIIELGEINFTLDNITDPTCGLSNGTFMVSGLIPDKDYEVRYDYQGTSVSSLFVADANGDLLVQDLGYGLYENIVVTEYLVNCSDELGTITLANSNIDYTINAVDPSFCGAQDGAITIGNLIPNADYSISYDFENTMENSVYTTDSSGILVVQDLVAGTYDNIEISDLINSCNALLESVTLSDSNVQIDVSSTSETACGNSDGSIVLQGLSANSTYSISYLFDGVLTNQDIVSSSVGEINLLNLSPGTYSINIFDTTNGCTTDLGEIGINPASLEVDVYFENPSYCGVSDGSITFAGLRASSDYEIRYTFNNDTTIINSSSDNYGNLVLPQLSDGNYSGIEISGVNDNCEASLPEIELSAPTFAPLVDVNHPTSCISEDGSIEIFGLIANTFYNISYVFQNQQVQFDVSSNENGQIMVESLIVGTYENLTVTSGNGICTFNEPSIEISCSGDLIGCFVTKKFFTPNGDGINDQWYLESLNGCEYQIKIFDRYGKLIQTLTPNNPYWDGSYNGNLMPSSDYWYSVEYVEESVEKVYQSHFSLVR